MRLKFDKITIPTTHVPFGGETGDCDFEFEGENLTGYAALITFSDRQGGTPISAMTLTTAGGSPTITVIWDPDDLDADGNVVGSTTLRGTISEAALEALDWGQIEPDKPLNLWCDVLLTSPGGVQQYACDGPVEVIKGIGDI